MSGKEKNDNNRNRKRKEVEESAKKNEARKENDNNMEIDVDSTDDDTTINDKSSMNTTTNNSSSTKKSKKAGQIDIRKGKGKQLQKTLSEAGWTVVKNPYKKVNWESANRRQNPRAEPDYYEGPAKESVNKTLGKFEYKTRVTVKLNIPATDDPKNAILNNIRELLMELSRADNGVAYLPWRVTDFAKGRIDDNTQFPHDFNTLRSYANRLFAGKQNENVTIYPNIYIGHNLSFEELRRKIQPWLSNGKNAMYRNILQVEEASQVGFFLYSTREMDAGALSDEITEMLGFPVGLRWRTINNGKPNLPVSQQVKALIVEVDAKKGIKDKKN